jgi:hypothetical protein
LALVDPARGLLRMARGYDLNQGIWPAGPPHMHAHEDTRNTWGLIDNGQLGLPASDFRLLTQIANHELRARAARASEPRARQLANQEPGPVELQARHVSCFFLLALLLWL